LSPVYWHKITFSQRFFNFITFNLDTSGFMQEEITQILLLPLHEFDPLGAEDLHGFGSLSDY
jgi:hypothetical protein